MDQLLDKTAYHGLNEPAMLGVVASVLAAVCKQMQQLPTILGLAVHCEKGTTHKTL